MHVPDIQIPRPEVTIEFDTDQPDMPGLCLAGNAYDGIGVSDCIRLGRKAAKELLAAR